MKNEIIFDKHGRPDIVVTYTAAELEELLGKNHPVLTVKGRRISELCVGKYPATMIEGLPYSLPFQKPAGRLDFDVAARFRKLIEGDLSTCRSVLLTAHNAQFDLLFVRQLLRGGRLNVRFHFLDTLTIYKDRAPYPHKLEAAITHYKLENKVKNSHRAIDDTCALLEVLKAMDAEREDLHTYVNVFGYNPKYGISGEKIAGITYHAQDFTKFKRPEHLTLPALVKNRR